MYLLPDERGDRLQTGTSQDDRVWGRKAMGTIISKETVDQTGQRHRTERTACLGQRPARVKKDRQDSEDSGPPKADRHRSDRTDTSRRRQSAYVQTASIPTYVN